MFLSLLAFVVVESFCFLVLLYVEGTNTAPGQITVRKHRSESKNKVK